jgi:hypothetical protein
VRIHCDEFTFIHDDNASPVAPSRVNVDERTSPIYNSPRCASSLSTAFESLPGLAELLFFLWLVRPAACAKVSRSHGERRSPCPPLTLPRGCRRITGPAFMGEDVRCREVKRIPSRSLRCQPRRALNPARTASPWDLLRRGGCRQERRFNRALSSIVSNNTRPGQNFPGLGRWRWGRVELHSARQLASAGVRRGGNVLALAPPLVRRYPWMSTFYGRRDRQNCHQVLIGACAPQRRNGVYGQGRVGFWGSSHRRLASGLAPARMRALG